jgi:hypothetical protein
VNTKLCRDWGCQIPVGWAKGKRRFVVSLAKLWELANKVSGINLPITQRSLLLGHAVHKGKKNVEMGIVGIKRRRISRRFQNINLP